MDRACVSVIIPVYNSAEYLRACVVSVLAQTYEEFELLLIDDGSTDGSAELLAELASGDERIRLFRQENAGASAARNLGMRMAEGRYCAFVDADDTVEADYLETAVRLLEENHADLAALSENCPGDFYWPNGHILKDAVYRFDSDEARLRFLLREYALCGIGYDPHGKLYDFDFLRGNGLDFHTGIHIGEDLAFHLECLFYAKTVVSSSKIVYTYFNRENSVTSQVKARVTLKVYDEFLSRVEARLPSDFWKTHYPAIYMRTMDIQFRQQPARMMAKELPQLSGCALWKRMVHAAAAQGMRFASPMGMKDSCKLYLKTCMYGALLGDCPKPQRCQGRILAAVLGVKLPKEKE